MKERGRPRSWEELYAEIARLPSADRMRLLARLLADTAAGIEKSGAAGASSGAEGSGAPTAFGGAPSSELGARSKDGVISTPSPEPRAPSRERSEHPASRLRIVVDGSNFLGTVPGYDLASAASRDRLVLRLQQYAHTHPGTRVTVFFDSRKPSATVRGGVEIRFSGAGRPADPFILAYLRDIPARERGDCVLVTGDMELASGARSLGVEVELPRRFQRRIPDPPAPPPDRGLNPREVEEWEEYFRQPKPDR